MFFPGSRVEVDVVAIRESTRHETAPWFPKHFGIQHGVWTNTADSKNDRKWMKDFASLGGRLAVPGSKK